MMASTPGRTSTLTILTAIATRVASEKLRGSSKNASISYLIYQQSVETDSKSGIEQTFRVSKALQHCVSEACSYSLQCCPLHTQFCYIWSYVSFTSLPNSNFNQGMEPPAPFLFQMT